MVLYAALAITGFVAFTTATAAAETNAVGAGFFFHIPGHSSFSSRTLLTSRQMTGLQCLKGMAGCDTECIDASFECCHVGQGQACEKGYTCYSQGCCRKGQTCSGPPKGCTATTKMCDVGCIPRDRVCCGLGDGSSCDADTVCLDSGLCGRQKSETGSSSSSGVGSASSRPSQTATLSTGGSAIVPGSSGLSSAGTSLRTRSDSAIGASITSSVSEVAVAATVCCQSRRHREVEVTSRRTCLQRASRNQQPPTRPPLARRWKHQASWQGYSRQQYI